MPPYCTLNTQNFPLVVATFTGESATDENFSAYLRGLRALYDREASFTLIFDASNAAIPGLKYQKLQADWMKQQEGLIRRYCLGTAYLIPNPVIRAVLRGIFALQSQAAPYVVVGSMEEAREWSWGRLGKGEE